MTIPSAASTALLATICLLFSPPSFAAGTPMTIDDLAALLEAGIGEQVILKQVRATGSKLQLTVESLLALKRAGASDSFLEALVEAPARPARQAEPEGPFRIFFAEGAGGERILHLTNLDDSGRRIGGEVERPASRNVVATGGPDARVPAAAPIPQEPPVVVNVYPPEAPEPFVADYGDYGDPFIDSYAAGRYPGFYGFVPRNRPHGYHSRRLRTGYVVPHNPLLPSPPGSYSHYLAYHHEGRSGFHPVRPLAGGGVSYTRATAAARNKARFGRR